MPEDFKVHASALLFFVGLVVDFVPRSTEIDIVSAGIADRQFVYAGCQDEARVPGATAPQSDNTPRTQSPAWLQQRHARIIHCLQSKLPEQVLSGSR
jgi:hypothetical protein